jgi:hypothetical protein
MVSKAFARSSFSSTLGCFNGVAFAEIDALA